MPNLNFSTRITARDNGGFLVERLCENVVIDRYTTADLKAPRRNKEPWIQQIAVMANTPPSISAQEQDEFDRVCAQVAWINHVMTENERRIDAAHNLESDIPQAIGDAPCN
jgi:hypothetical protein